VDSWSVTKSLGADGDVKSPQCQQKWAAFDDELSPFACVIPSLVVGNTGHAMWMIIVRGVAYHMRILGTADSRMLCGEAQ